MNKYVEKQEMPTLKELSEVLKNDDEIAYVTETSKVASAEYDVPSENPSSIFTKLNEYPYEFEINGELQLASINGIKIAKNEKSNTGGKVLIDNQDIIYGQEIEFEGNIYDYEKIEILTAVIGSDSGVKLCGSASINTKNICLPIDESPMSYLIVTIMSNPKYYSTLHYSFSTNNKIKLIEEQVEGWDLQPTSKITVIGY